jgi:hypothetical protein
MSKINILINDTNIYKQIIKLYLGKWALIIAWCMDEGHGLQIWRVTVN